MANSPACRNRSQRKYFIIDPAISVRHLAANALTGTGLGQPDNKIGAPDNDAHGNVGVWRRSRL